MSRDLLQRIEHLPKSLQQEVLHFIEFLLARKKTPRKSSSKKSKLNFEWEGALKKDFKKMSSVELQHKIWD